MKLLWAKILREEEQGCKMVEVDGKGRGVIATQSFSHGDYVSSRERLTF